MKKNKLWRILRIVTVYILLLSLSLPTVATATALELGTFEPDQSTQETTVPTEAAEPTEVTEPTGATTPAETTEPIEVTEPTEEGADEEEPLDQSSFQDGPPEQITVSFLEEYRSMTPALLALEDESNDLALTIKIVDQDGNEIGVTAPHALPQGFIRDAIHAGVIQEELAHAGALYDYYYTRVGNNPCVYLAEYDGTVYYSLDGHGAVPLADDAVIELVYWEYYAVTFNDTTTSSATGTIIVQDTVLTEYGEILQEDVTVPNKGTLRVLAYKGIHMSWSAYPGIDPSNNCSYALADVNGAAVDEADEYGKKFSELITSSMTYNVKFSINEKLHVSFNADEIYADYGSPQVIYKEYGKYDAKNDPGTDYFTPGTKKIVLKGNGEGSYGIYDEYGFFTRESTLIQTLALNGQPLNLPEIPPNTTDEQYAETVIDAPNGTYTVTIRMDQAPSAPSWYEVEYAYAITIENPNGIYEDLNFDTTYAKQNDRKSAMDTAFYVGEELTDRGIEIVQWDGAEFTPVHMGQPLVTESSSGTHRQVYLFFFNLKPGYRFAGFDTEPDASSTNEHPIWDGIQIICTGAGRTDWAWGFGTPEALAPDGAWHGVWHVNDDDDAKMWTESLNIDQAYEAANGKYAYAVRFCGQDIALKEDQYIFSIHLSYEDIYVNYDYPAGESKDTIQGMPQGYFPKIEDLDDRGLEINVDSHTMQPAPTKKGYTFTGWKLVGPPEDEPIIYPPEDSFTPTDENLKYAAEHEGPFYLYTFEPVFERDPKYYEVQYFLPTVDVDGKFVYDSEGAHVYEEEPTATDLCLIPDVGTEVRILPYNNPDDHRFDKFMPYYGHDDNILTGMVQEIDGVRTVVTDVDGTNVLKLYYIPNDEIAYTTLVLSKNVMGNRYNDGSEFEFTIVAKPPADAEGENISTWTKTVKLKHGETAKIELPEGYLCTIKEKQDPDFSASYRIGKDSSAEPTVGLVTSEFTLHPMEEGTIPDNNYVQFINTTIPPGTGVKIAQQPILPMLLLAGFLLVPLYFIRKRFSRK